jgi:hypothetical protein
MLMVRAWGSRRSSIIIVVGIVAAEACGELAKGDTGALTMVAMAKSSATAGGTDCGAAEGT